MRTVKFRGKHIETGVWGYDDLMQRGSHKYICNIGKLNEPDVNFEVEIL